MTTKDEIFVRELGTFEVSCGKILVTDPCYKKGSYGTGVVENVMNGKWRSFITLEPFSYEEEATDYESFYTSKDTILSGGPIPKKWLR